jgi:hypothetical protein
MARTLLLAALASAVLARSEPLRDPRFAVREGSTVRKVFEHHLKAESTAVRIYDAAIDQLVDVTSTIGMTIDQSGTIEVADEYLAIADGRPAKLRRTFARIDEREDQHARYAMGGGRPDNHQDHLKLEASELEGRSVVFTLGSGASAYATAFANEGGDDALLDGLNEDMDFRFLLPPGKVAVGEEWAVDPKLCGAIVAPGGDLKLKQKDASSDPGWSIGRELRKNLEGKAKAVWKGVREEDGRRVGVVGVELDLKSAGESRAKDTKAGAIRFRMDLALAGDLVWDLEAGRFATFRAGGKLRYEMSARKTVEADGAPTESRYDIDFDGEAEYSASAR